MAVLPTLAAKRAAVTEAVDDAMGERLQFLPVHQGVKDPSRTSTEFIGVLRFDETEGSEAVDGMQRRTSSGIASLRLPAHTARQMELRASDLVKALERDDALFEVAHVSGQHGTRLLVSLREA